jgi:hypothetical protein
MVAETRERADDVWLLIPLQRLAWLPESMVRSVREVLAVYRDVGSQWGFVYRLSREDAERIAALAGEVLA